MASILEGLTIAILVANGFQQDEMTSPAQALRQAGATVKIVSLEHDFVQGWDWYIPKAMDSFPVDVHIDSADPNDYDALLLPGGLLSPDDLRLNPHAVAFVRSFAHKPIAAICHGPWLLIDAHLVKGKTLTSWPSIKEDLKNAGAIWVDANVIVDQGLVTSRSPEDLLYFNQAMLQLLSNSIDSLHSF
jgi:protease I